MGKLIVNRRSEYANRGRKIGLYLDKKKIGTIENGEVKEFEVSPGTYMLKAKIDWCSSQEHIVSIKENETKSVKLRGFLKRKWTLPILIVIQLLFLVISRYIEINQYLMLAYALGVLVYIFYPITFGKDHYLKLES